jgi:hypothetical protein
MDRRAEPSAAADLFYASLPLYAAFSLMFLACAATLPDRIPDQGIDLREYYFANTRRVWGLFAGAFAFGLVTVAAEFFLSGWDVAVLRENLVRGPVAPYCRYRRLASVPWTLRADANWLMRRRLRTPEVPKGFAPCWSLVQ